MKTRKIITITGSVLAISTVLLMTGCGKSFDFQEAIEINFEGLNGNGRISAEIDDSIFDNDELAEKLFPDSSSREASLELFGLLADVNYSFSEEENLSNGDVITVTVEYDSDSFNDNDIKTKNAEFEVKVEGLSDGETIDVFEGLDISYSGFSGSGYAVLDESNCDWFVHDYVYFQYDESGLSNGDTLTVTANYSQEDAEDNLIIVKSDTKEYTVSGLKETEKIDPFENLELTYTGASPYVSLSVDSTKCSSLVNDYISFNIEEGYLKNGDTFTITANYNEYDAQQYGFTVTSESKQYTVENQPEYVTSLGGLDLSELKRELDDKLSVATSANEGDYEFAGVWNYPSFSSIAESKFRSSYLVSLKTNFEDKFDNGRNYNYNRYMQIYEYLVNFGDEQKNIYVIVFANNIQKNTDGTISWDVELGSKGYDNYDSLINDFVTSEKEYYNVSEVKE